LLTALRHIQKRNNSSNTGTGSGELKSTTGNWSGRTGDVTITVTKVEMTRNTGEKKGLRFYVTVNNQLSDPITLPLYGSFSAAGDGGTSYEADPFGSDWPKSFPAGSKVSGSINLKTYVPQDISRMNLSFAHIMGSLQVGREGITISDVEIP
jgi:hypothetical protein